MKKITVKNNCREIVPIFFFKERERQTDRDRETETERQRQTLAIIMEICKAPTLRGRKRIIHTERQTYRQTKTRETENDGLCYLQRQFYVIPTPVQHTRVEATQLLQPASGDGIESTRLDRGSAAHRVQHV